MRRIEIQGKVFEGYSLWLDLSKYADMEDIISCCRTHLLNFLHTFNLKHLCAHAQQMTLQNNLYPTYRDMIECTTENDTIYLYENQKQIHSIPEENTELLE